MPEDEVPPCAMLGVGAMGGRMAARLLKAGIQVTVWNRTPARTRPLVALGARFAPSPRAAVDRAAIVLVMVEDDEASREVWSGPEGFGQALPPGAIAIECSTLSAGRVAALASDAAARNWRFVEAPVSGSLPQAEAGSLVFLVGGAADDVVAVAPLLMRLGAIVHHIGAPPMATLVKLCVNGLLACQVAAFAEMSGLLARAGLDARRLTALLADTPVASPILAATGRQIASGDHAPLFPIALAVKDLNYLALAAEAVGAPTPLARSTLGLFEAADAWRAENISAVAKLFAAPVSVSRPQK